LPHATENFGVTEVNYGIGIITIMNSFFDRDLIWKSRMEDIIPMTIETYLPPGIAELELRYFAVLVASILFTPIMLLSLYRVMTHEKVCDNNNHMSAASTLTTPLLLAATPLLLLPESVVQNNCRAVSIATALVFCLLTVKMICYSMANMTYASFQLEALPYFLVCVWIRSDGNMTELGTSFFLRYLCLWYVGRLLNFARITINQICHRLDIFCFSIKKKVE